MYSDIVLDHFMNPRNVGFMPEADGIGTVGDPACGDSVTFCIKVEGDIISEIAFLVFGCTASIATGSVTTVLAKGKTINEALKITENDVIKVLEGLPCGKEHCSNLGVHALRNAINDYLNKQAKY